MKAFFRYNNTGGTGEEQGVSLNEVKIVMKKMLWLCLFMFFAAPAFALDFALTPEGAELLRERGSVGYLYWGLYREC